MGTVKKGILGDFSGKVGAVEVHTYMGFVSESGMEVADSVYLSGITVA